jgi:hypothetical protein
MDLGLAGAYLSRFTSIKNNIDSDIWERSQREVKKWYVRALPHMYYLATGFPDN